VINLPDLSHSKYSSWGDWGPIYKFNNIEPILITQGSQHYSLKQVNLKIESPMSYKTRLETRFYIEIDDNLFNRKFRLFVDSDFKLVKVETKTVLGEDIHYVKNIYSDRLRQAI